MKQGLRQIRAFLAVAETASFTRAAQQLHVSQPTLTVQIHQLEGELQLRLFDRDKHRVSLTAQGQRMLAPLGRVLADFEQAVTLGQDLAGLRQGRLTIATLPSIAADWLPQQIANLRQQHPGIEIRIVDVAADRIQPMLLDDSADLGLGPWLSRDRRIRFQELQVDHMHVFCLPEHPLTALRQPTLRAVARYPQVLTTRGSSVRQAVHRALETEQLDVDIACEVAYLSTAIGMVRAGLGVAMLPLSARQAASCEGIETRPIRAAALTRRLGLLTRAGTSLSPAAQAFADRLQPTATGH